MSQIQPPPYNPNEWEVDNLPNRLTMFRMLLIPVVVLALYAEEINYPWFNEHHLLLNYVAAWTFVIASITDYFDGFFARKMNIVTMFGSFLDPLADKFLVISSLIMLLSLERINVLVALILILRELYITALRLLALEKGLNVPVGTLGKWKTTFQMIAIPLLMANDTPWGIPMTLLGEISITLASIFSLYSALEYSVGLLRKLRRMRIELKRAKRKILKEQK